MADFADATISITARDISNTIGTLYIVRDLAAVQPLDRSGSCKFCGQHRTCIEPHDKGCVWRRAHDLVRSGALDGKRAV